MAKETKEQTKPRGNAAVNKSSAAGKRSEQQPKAAGKGASSKPATAERQSGAAQKTTSTTQGEKQNCPKVDAEVKRIAGEVQQTKPEQERQGIIKRLIETLKRVIGYKKGERDEVRYNNKEGHKNWVFKKKGDKYIAFGVTHDDETFGRKNMPLKENPDPKDKRKAYIRNGIIKQKGGMSKNTKKNLKFSPEDKTNMKSKRRYHEKERKRQQAKQSAKKEQKSK